MKILKALALASLLTLSVPALADRASSTSVKRLDVKEGETAAPLKVSSLALYSFMRVGADEKSRYGRDMHVLEKKFQDAFKARGIALTFIDAKDWLISNPEAPLDPAVEVDPSIEPPTRAERTVTGNAAFEKSQGVAYRLLILPSNLSYLHGQTYMDLSGRMRTTVEVPRLEGNTNWVLQRVDGPPVAAGGIEWMADIRGIPMEDMIKIVFNDLVSQGITFGP